MADRVLRPFASGNPVTIDAIISRLMADCVYLCATIDPAKNDVWSSRLVVQDQLEVAV
jgi:hypothetical protein